MIVLNKQQLYRLPYYLNILCLITANICQILLVSGKDSMMYLTFMRIYLGDLKSRDATTLYPSSLILEKMVSRNLFTLVLTNKFALYFAPSDIVDLLI